MAIVNMCVGCNNPINDMYHLIVGDQFYWHVGCLKCSVCHCMLQMENKCYMNNGKFYCLKDFTGINQAKKEATNDHVLSCRKCTKHINSNDYVINISENPMTNSCVYHMNCFSCSECHVLISPGHPYGTYNQEIFCTNHYINLLSMHQNKSEYTVLQSLNSDRQSSDSKQNDAKLSTSQINREVQYNVPNHIMDHSSSLSLSSTSSISSCMSSSSSSSSSSISPTSQRISTTTNGNSRSLFKTKSSSSEYPSSRSSNYLLSKKKRIRTSFKHQQLRIMKAHFQVNQNPDSKDLKELSERTGLQKRVLQVWFQNSRAKQRKSSGNFGIGMHQLGQGMIGQSNGVSADSSINLDDEDAFSEEEEEESDSDEVCDDEKHGIMSDLMPVSAREGRFDQDQKQLTSNNLVDFYHF